MYKYIYTYGKRLEQNTVAGHEVFLYHTIKSETHMYVCIYIYIYIQQQIMDFMMVTSAGKLAIF